MRSKESWVPSKYLLKNGHFTASRDVSNVGIGSRLIVDIIAQFYQSYIPKHVKGRLLDLGCGKVPLFEMYKDYIIDNMCVDWDNTLHDNKYVDVTCDSPGNLPFEEEQFETIILSDVMEHLPNPEKLWKEMFRLLAPGGKVLLNVPFLYWIHEAPHDYYRYTEFAVKRFAELSGFSIILLEPIGGAPEVLADISSKVFARYTFGKWIAVSIQYLGCLAIKTKIIKRISKKTSELFPLGYFIIVEKPEFINPPALV